MKEEGIPQHLVINPLDVTTFSGTGKKVSEDTSVPWQEIDVMSPWLLTFNIHGKLLRRLSPCLFVSVLPLLYFEFVFRLS